MPLLVCWFYKANFAQYFIAFLIFYEIISPLQAFISMMEKIEVTSATEQDAQDLCYGKISSALDR